MGHLKGRRTRQENNSTLTLNTRKPFSDFLYFEKNEDIIHEAYVMRNIVKGNESHLSPSKNHRIKEKNLLIGRIWHEIT